MIEHFGEERGTELFRKYRDAFLPATVTASCPCTAVADIARIEELESEEDIEMSLYHPLEEPENFLGFKLFRLGEQISLSGILPLLEDMGVEVVDERPHRIESRLADRSGSTTSASCKRRRRAQTGEVRRSSRTPSPGRGAEPWRTTVQPPGPARPAHLAPGNGAEAYRKYLRQAGTTFSQNYMEDAPREPAHRPLLVRLFEARFDPSRQRAPKLRRAVEGEIEEALERS